MFLFSFHVLVLLFNSIYFVKSLPKDVDHLRDHFITNLIEEHRQNFKMELTEEIQKSIDQKIDAFLHTLDAEESNQRKRRSLNDILLNEKPTDVTVLKGFEHRGVVPVNFPRDICMFRIHRISFAVSLNYGKAANKNERITNVLSIFKRNNGTFFKIHEYKSPFLTKIDCSSVDDVGYVAVLNSLNINLRYELLDDASFVYRVRFDEIKDETTIEKLQTFAEPNQLSVRLWSRNDNLYLIYTYDTDWSAPLEKCTVFKLTGDNFNPIDTLPCQNARVIEFFTVNHNLMILIGNYRENNGTTNAFSLIMRYDLVERRFVEHQKLYTNAITVGKYFYLEHQHQRHHFLFVGNSFEINEFNVINYDVLSLIYKYVDGFFIPLQTINAKHVQAVAPVMSKNNEFHLLIASEETEVQIYYYDGWKFQESPIDFTGKSFSSDVINMRSYDNIIDGTTTVVISNVNSFGNEWNIFSPVYKIYTDSSNLKANIVNWCTNAFVRLQEFDVNETEELLKAAINLTDSSNPYAKLSGNILIKNSTINLVNAEQFMRKDLSIFNSTSVERINEMANRYKRLQNDVKRLKNKIDFTTSNSRSRRQADDNTMNEPIINNLIVENTIHFQTINGKSINDLVYKSNRRNKGLKRIVANETLIKRELNVNEKVDGIKISEENLLFNTPQQLLNPMLINKISVQNLEVQNVNNMQFSDFFTQLRRKVDKKIPNMIHQLDVDELNVGGLINDKNFTSLSMNSLKTNGNQIITGEIEIENLQTDGIMFKKDNRYEAISRIPVSHLINIKEESQVPLQIIQDIQFSNDVVINNLYIQERLSNINVRNGELQVLRRRGPQEQIVIGEKSFHSVNLKQPIVLRGKIQSKTLEKMNPIVTIDKNLVLEGDYVITGPVTIRQTLNATENILTNNNELNLRKLAETGLNLFTTSSTNLRLNFKDVVQVQNSFNAISINGKNVDSFVKINSTEQLVTGLKTFKNGLNVRNSIIEALTINDIDLQQLNATILKRNAPFTQFVDGNIEFANLKVDGRLYSANVNIDDKNVEELLSTSRSQNIKQISMSLVRAQQLYVDSLEQTNGAKIFGKDLNFIIDDTIKVNSYDNSIIAKKNFGNLQVNQLEFTDDNEWKSIIGNFNNRIVQEFNVSNNHIFERQMMIENLRIYGTINGISQEDMSKNWLQVEGEQTFTESQSFKYAQVDGDINLSNSLVNHVRIDRLFEDTIWIDSEEVRLNSLEVNGILGAREGIKTIAINDVEFKDDDFVKNNTKEYQKLNKIKILNDARILELSHDTINDINIKNFVDTFKGNDGDLANLKVNGIVTFDNVNTKILNGVDVEYLYNNTWLNYQNVTLTGDVVHFNGINYIDGILYAEYINNKNLDVYGNNYFSKTSDQQISAHLYINGNVIATKGFYTEKVILPKFINFYEYFQMNLTHFAENILRHDTSQHIRGNWTIHRLYLQGNYDGLINGMNLNTDVLHTSNMNTAEITGHKRIGHLQTRDVITSFVNGIELYDWFEHCVRINSQTQQLIDGTVTFKGYVQLDNNLQVRGTVNGIVVRPDTILRKSKNNQIINGDVTIIGDGRPKLIENLKLKESINGVNWKELYENVFTKHSTFINSSLLVFDKELDMNSVWTNGSIYGTDIAEFLKGSTANNKMIRFKGNMEKLTNVCDDLMRSLDDSVVELSHFEHHQSIKGVNIQSTVLLAIENGDIYEYALAVHEKNKMEMINFYHWDREKQLFVKSPQLLSIQYNGDLYRITQFHKIIYNDKDHLYVELFDNIVRDFYQYLMHYDPQLRRFVPIIQNTDSMSMKIFTWTNSSVPCYGASYESFEDIKLNCAGYPQTVIKTRPIRKIASHDGILIMLTDERVRVWYNSTFFNLPIIINTQNFASIRYNEKLFLAIQSDRAEGTVHHGYINIYVSSVTEMNFQFIQRISLNMPTAVKFSIAPSDDLMLYVLTRNPTKALNIYSYAGSSNFVEVIGDTTIVSEASDLDIIQIDNKMEVLSVVSGDVVYIIQAVLVEY